jgi:hypothetical protein
VYTGGEGAGDTVVYGYNVGEGGGFVVVSGDDAVRGVLGYAEAGGLEEGEMGENVRWWLEFYGREIKAATEGGDIGGLTGSCLRRNDKEEGGNDKEEGGEDVYGSGGEEGTREGEGEMQLGTARWNQTEPYNLMCPMDWNGKRTVAGCVATAMAEVLHYHRWPWEGLGGSIEMLVEGRIRRNWESFGVWYDHNHMLESYKDVEASEAEQVAVAQLVYHCGRAVGMNYNVSGSGATAFAMQKALIDNFSYDAGCKLAFRDIYGVAEWGGMIRREIAEGRPVLYSGSGEEGGHMFVVDGYKGEDFFHVNWGWSGVSNGFFVLSALNPLEQGTGGGEGGFNTQQDALLGLQPAEVGWGMSAACYEIFFTFLGEARSMSRAPGIYTLEQAVEQDKAFRLCYSGLLNYGFRTYTGNLACFMEDEVGNIKAVACTIQWGGKRNMTPNIIYNELSGVPALISTEIREGDRLRLYYTLEDGTYQPVGGEAGSNLTVELRARGVSDGVGVSPVVRQEERRCYDMGGRRVECEECEGVYIEVSEGKVSKRRR